jgi:transposase-like protein
MVLHANAALSRRQRERLVALVLAGVTITAAAALVGCSRQTGSKWVGRHRRGEGLDDRSSRRSASRAVPSEESVPREATENPAVAGLSARLRG